MSGPAENGTRSEDTLVAGMFDLHDVTSQTSYCFQKKSLEDKIWLGEKDDWIIITDKRCSLSIFNPISGAYVSLPSFTTIEGHQNCEYRTIRRVVLCQTPASTNGHLALALFDDGVLAITAKQYEVWRTFKH